MKQIPILQGKALLIELPEVSPTPYVINTGRPHLSYLDIDVDLPEVDLPPGNWKIVGMLPEVTEEQAGMLVEKVMNGQHHQNYNYKSVIERWVKTALESLESAILAEGYTFTNSLGNEKEYKKKYKGHPMFFANHMAKWFEAQSRVLCRERCLLLMRVDV